MFEAEVYYIQEEICIGTACGCLLWLFFFVIFYEVYFGSVCREAVKTFEESVSVYYVHTSGDEISLGNLFMNVECN